MRHLGQHFLKHAATAKKIVAALNLHEGDTTIEVGPGHGELTQEIKNKISNFKIGQHELKSTRLIAIEKDRELAQKLRERFAKNPEIEIVEGDARAVLRKMIGRLASDTRHPVYKLVGNIPYYLTGNLLRILSELKHPPTRAVLMLQKEVAERIAAKPPRMNRLAAIVQYWADPKILGLVLKNQFDPPPKVDTAIIVLNAKENLPIPREIYFRTVKILFAQPRKTALNNLAAASSALKGKGKEEMIKMLGHLGINARTRPQDLGIETIVDIARAYS